MFPSAHRVCSEPGGQKTILSLSLDRIHRTDFHKVLKDETLFRFDAFSRMWIIVLTDGRLVKLYVIRDLVNIGSSNGLSPDSKPVPGSMLTYCQLNP